MMSERSKAINVCSIPTSSSRLSPLARPFTAGSPFNRREYFDPLLGSSSSSTSGLDQPFTYLNLGVQCHRGYYAYQSDSTAITASPFVNGLDFELNSCFTSYPSEDSPVQTHSTLLTQTSFTPIPSSLGNVGSKSAVQQGIREVPRRTDRIAAGVSLSCEGTTIEGSKLVSKAPSVLHEKGCVVVGKANRIRPVVEDKLQTEISVFRPANSEVNILNKCMTKSLPTSSRCDSDIITNERCFPHLASCTPETLVSSDPSGASYNAPIVNPVPLENVAYGGTDTVSNMDSYFGYVVPGMIRSDTVRSPLDKVACQDQVLTKKGEKRYLVEPIHNETKYPYVMEISKLRIACPNGHEDFTVQQNGAKAGTPDDKWSTNSDDSDVDSPCWKGTQAYKSPLRDSVHVNPEDVKGQSSSRVSMSLKLERSKSEKVACNSLNPLAPVFIPGNSKQKVNELRCSDKAGTCLSEEINDIGMFWSYDVGDSREGYDTTNESFINLAVNSCCPPQPYLGGEYVSTESQLENVAGGMEGTADATYNALDSVMDIADTGPNSSILFPTTETALNSHSIGDGVSSDLTERFQEPPKSTPPKLDAKLLINTIQYLSELLLQNYSLALGSMSDHEYDKILNIINNLYVVIRNQVGERAVRPESCHMCTSYDKRQATDHHKIQVNRKDRKVVHSTEDEMPQEALFYRKLWLEAKTALYHQEHGIHVKPEPDKF
ncbi:hypothetical protein HRI_004300200 [Hibiscus trionum]|uniref:Uncharacterized protein n=1 Tax=Hibiscus trionum TaxID=183268 RepID=A0A9W7MNX4_HIBTR|nr:hypothetical protein HRI_004300200 [Hibiscus trionum]